MVEDKVPKQNVDISQVLPGSYVDKYKSTHGNTDLLPTSSKKKHGSVLALQVKGNQRVCMHVEEDDIVKMISGEWRKIFFQDT